MKRSLLQVFWGLLLSFFVLVVGFQVFGSLSAPSIKSDFHHQKSKIKKKERAPGELRSFPEFHAKWQKEIRTPVDRQSPEYTENYLYDEWNKSRGRMASSRTEALEFEERGPGNISGRTRALLIDSRDSTNNTWFAGGVSGGIWKTMDAGITWAEKGVALPTISISWFSSSLANPDVIYAGTGEPFCGGGIEGLGILKSIDGGETWNPIVDINLLPDFKNVARIITDPSDENVVIAATQVSEYTFDFRSSIYKSVDGGITWNRTFTSVQFPIQDLDFTPGDFQVQFASVAGFGVLKSEDGGDSWSKSSFGLVPAGRIELDVSPVNPSRVWASVEGFQSSNGSDLYVSSDGGGIWELMSNFDETDDPDFLGGQGCYDNIIKAHPYDSDVVYAAGVDFWKFSLEEGEGDSLENVDIDIIEVATFMDFVSFGGAAFGFLDVGDSDSLVSVEIRFGQGTQMAHRFSTDQRGSGVPDSEYKYLDYVEVPFQVWDVTNNIQLMASFRDQQEDGEWNLIERDVDGPVTGLHSREYLFIHQVAYGEQADSIISNNGGHVINRLYFFWPVLGTGATFDPEALPSSTLKVTVGKVSTKNRATTKLSDSFPPYETDININRQSPPRTEDGIHPDHHNILIIPEENEKFRLLVSNDGGVYLSNSSLDPGNVDMGFEYRSLGYNTTQFYGADKAPGEDRYAGGMQDNGTFISPPNAGPLTQFEFFNGGDGFETVWNNRDGNLIIGGSQNNGLARSGDGGVTSVGVGFDDDGPFWTKISNTKSYPDRLFAIGASGVWKSLDFGLTWRVTKVNSDFWPGVIGTGISSSTRVEASEADRNIVWTGNGISDISRLLVSTNGGGSFTPVNNYQGTPLGTISGLGLDPIDNKTAYALFSFAGRPKVLKTTDLGENWEDISGFEGNDGQSNRGFPDVAVFSILVFPNDVNRIWVGSEIGIIESLDGGAFWNILNSNLPAVNIYDFKVQDDEVVLATYGRGIWSVAIPEVQQQYTFAPFLDNFSIDPFGKTSFEIDFSSEFDSTLIFIDGIRSILIDANDLGNLTTTINNLGLNGRKTVKIIGYLAGEEYELESLNKIFFRPEDPVELYRSNFVDNTAFDEIASDGLFIAKVNGFTNLNLNSQHPHGEQEEFVAILKTPISIVNENATLTYRDVAIIEPGEEGTVFGDFEFWDYVIVEGSTDGKNWIPFAPGYDARFDTTWLNAYENEIPGDESMFVFHEVLLAENFNVGDVILVRFRLSSDPNAVGWGWTVEDIRIQNEVLGIESLKQTVSLEVFPNPFIDQTKFRLDRPLSSDGIITVVALDGKVIRNMPWPRGTNSFEFQRANLRPGVYLLKLETNNQVITQRILIR